MERERKLVSICLFLLLSSPLLLSNIGANYSLVNIVDWNRIVTHGKFLSGLGTRMTGYPGYYTALDYTSSVLSSYGLTPIYQEFEVTVPLSLGATIEVISTHEAFEAFPLQPNLVALSSTPREGISGHLIFAGKGEFDGKTVENAIVLMDMDSDDKWIRAASLGAKAIIFFANSPITYYQAEHKKLNIPLNIPRVYIERDVAEKLLQLLSSNSGPIEIVLKSAVTWASVKAKNIFAMIPGEVNETIILAAHIDSSSIVMEKAPGAREALNVAFLLELARFYSKNRPKRNLLIAFLSGHHQNLAGARYFVEENFNNISRDLKMFIGLDLGSDGGEKICLVYAGWTYYYYLLAGGSAGGLTASNKIRGLYDAINTQVIPQMGILGQYVDNALTDNPRGIWEKYMSIPLGFDHEAYTLAGGLGFTIIGSYDTRLYWKTPDDVLENIDLSRFRTQVEVSSILIDRIICLENIPSHPELVPTRYSNLIGRAGFATLAGSVVKYDFKTAWYRIIDQNTLENEYGKNSSILVHVYLRHPSATYPFLFDMLIKADRDGKFIIYGVPTINTWWSTTQFTSEAAQLTASDLIIEPYIIDQYGNILAAPDFGRYGSPKRFHRIDREFYIVDRVAVFNCASIVLFDLPETRYENVLKTELINRPSLSHLIMENLVFNIHGHVPTDFQFASAASTSNVMIVYVPPNEDIEIIWKSSYRSFPDIILTNNSRGYNLSLGKQLMLRKSFLEITRDVILTIKQRLKIASDFNVMDVRANFLVSLAEKALNNAVKYYDEKCYSKFINECKIAWNYATLAYIYSRELYADVANIIVFFSMLTVPASLLLSALFFGTFSTYKRIIANIFVFLSFILILFFFHPGFHLASNTLMVLIGFASVLLLMPVELLLAGLFYEQIKKFRQKMMGLHIAEISRLSAALIAFSIGIENMKRRKLRTILTGFSLAILTFSLTALTSLPSILMEKDILTGNVAPYTGIMLQRDNLEPFSSTFLEHILQRYSEVAFIGPRIWLYPKTLIRGGSSGGISAELEVFSETKKTTIAAVLGLSSNDPLILTYKKALMKDGVFFLDEEKAWICLISDDLAKTLDVNVGGKIRLLGFKFTVVGIFDGTILSNVKDFNGKRITPVDLTRPGGDTLDPIRILIVPWKTCLDIGGQPMQITIGFKKDEALDIRNYAKNLALETSLNPYYGLSGDVIHQITVYTSISTYGLQYFFVILVIVSLIIFDMMLGMIEERTREIRTLGTLGLSPLHISFMFLAEISEYAILGSLFGYIGGIIIIRFLGVGFGLPLNYSSNLVIMSVGTSIATTFIASLFPVRKVSRTVTPSLERRWKIPTKPQGIFWEIPLPFSCTFNELPGVLAFMSEYISSHSEEGIGRFISSKTSVELTEYKGKYAYIVRSEIRLPPYDQTIAQKVDLIALPNESKEKYDFLIRIERISGIAGTWKRSNILFVDDLRKQLLIWRTLREPERNMYINKGMGAIRSV